MGEFDLIERYLRRPATRSPLGVGDDCALLAPAPGMQLAVSTDMLVEGRHFLSTVDPGRLGHKALAVNLSDLAACGAKPLAFTLALALPAIDEAWLEAFSRGLFALADAHGCELVGGDTTRGPLNLCITVFGEVPAGAALLRSGAKPGDELWVSGTLGDARLALEVFRGTLALPPEAFEQARRRMEQPEPRVALGQALRGIASAAVDLSDGLVGDLGHILAASGVGATVDADAACALIGIPAAAALDPALRRTCALAGGDDYELLFAAPPAAADAVLEAGRLSTTPVARIGRIEAAPGLRIVDAQGASIAQAFAAFDHFQAKA
ncbi:thiamine-phosphate kinase [Variovorax sp. WS11]|uniref:thiamine-phosphate kinase n=1 Tax=Variovorax sp. WS11 TaxID=1105204 RepID=UPI000D0D62D8|nr:thiamine-phosphate kinase [Variovorax sp. WS11]NDZ13170.1 thiamine-phosphate kinase [Variovorax sp. WS11]PSL79700.1 thiamine-phosphate kinase [Variovorax sp. WS11]